MKKSIKITMLVILSIFISLWIWSFSVKSSYILLGGSTSCNEFMQEATNEYDKKEVIYSSVGSQAGINGAKNRSFSAGFVSKDISPSDIDDSLNKQNDHSDDSGYLDSLLKTSSSKYYEVSFAKDAIEIIYQPPSWWNEDLNDVINFNLPDTSEENSDWLQKIYENNISWEEIADSLKDEYNLSVEIPKTNTKFITFTRESGSGTRDSFNEKTNITDLSYSNVVNSNGLMLQNVASIQGSIGYISYSFNKNIEKDSGVVNAAINNYKFGNSQNGSDNALVFNKDQKKFIDSKETNEDIIKEEEYKFTRSFSLIFNTSINNLEDLKSFINYLLSDESLSIYNDDGLIQIKKIYSFE